MTFLYPQVLWFLFSLSIPVIIHFFNFRRIKVLEFSTLQFIEEVKNETRRKKNLKHILILISRLLFLAFLILAFAQPVSTEKGNESFNTAIYMDNSYSMSTEVAEGKTALQESLEYARSYISKAAIDERFLILTNDFTIDRNNWLYKSGLEETMANIGFTSTNRSFAEVISRLEDINVDFKLLFFSDFQRSTIGEPSSTSFKVKLVPVKSFNSKNIYVDSVYFDSPVLLFDNSNILHVTISNSGQIQANNIQLKILNDNKLIATSTVKIEAGSSINLEFELELRNLGSNLLKIEITDFPVTFDNEYWISLSSFQPPRVIYVYTETENIFIKSVFGNDQLFNFRSFAFKELDYTELSSADLIVLDSFESIPDGIFNVNPSADWAVIPSFNSDLANYSSFFGTQLARNADTTMKRVKISDINDPLFSDIFSESSESNDLPNARIMFDIQSANNILSTQFDQSFMSKFIRGDQTLYFLASPLDPQYTTFPTHSIFLPLFYRIAQLSKQAQPPIAYTADQKVITIRSESMNTNDVITIFGPENEFVPNFNVRGKTATLELPPGRLGPGYYYVTNGADTLQTLAINHSKKESDLAKFSENQLVDFASRLGNADIIESGSSPEFLNNLNNQSGSVRLWKYALLLSLIFVFTEILLIRFL